VQERYGALDLDSQARTDALATATAIQKQMWRTVFDRYVASRVRATHQAILKLPNEIQASMRSRKS
jgi:hypothetical protein